MPPHTRSGRAFPSPGARPLCGARPTGAVFLSLSLQVALYDDAAHQRRPWREGSRRSMHGQRRLVRFSRLAARFSSNVLAGFFLDSFFRSILLLMVTPSALIR